MNSSGYASKLLNENLISESSHEKITSFEASRLFSIGLELKTILYAGVLLLAGGLGIAIYKNIDSIGHMAVILFMAAVSAGSFFYCYKKSLPYSREKVNPPDVFYPYVLLLGALTCISFIAYLQFQYTVFGTFNGMAFLLPAIILLSAAYYFDHIGVLTMALTSFAAFAGITISPDALLNNGNELQSLVYTGNALGILFLATGGYLSSVNIKKHFTYTYFNFAMHLLYIFSLTGLIDNGNMFVFIPLLAAITYTFMRYAFSIKSFYFFLMTVIYGYIGITYLIIRLLERTDTGILGIYLIFIYFIVSSVYIIRFLKSSRKKMKVYDNL